jgi:hypothetical protein
LRPSDPATGDAQQESEVVDILDRLESIGPVEVGVYNAGNAIWGPPLETKTTDFEAMWRVGCLGGFIFGREVARRMLPRGYGTIIYSGASAALRGRAAFAAFAAAEAGLRMVSQSFAREFGPRGITSLTSSSMCAHIQKPFELGRPISSHRSRHDIFGGFVEDVVRFFPTRPCREASERVEASYLLARDFVSESPTIFDLAAGLSRSSLPEFT